MKASLRWLLLFIAAALLAAGYLTWLLHDLPSPEGLPTRMHPPSVRITDRNGRLLYEALPQEGGRHAVVPLEQIPLALRQATIAVEDRRFYQHPGVDLAGILRAAWINLKGGETLAGGSTITQQVARNLLLDAGERAERSLRRKLRESYLAWQITRRYSKDDILALYLNQSYYGGMAYGVEAAAQTFFGKPVSRLDLAECALLAGLPQAPAAFNPFTQPEAAKARQAIVLRLMEQDGFIDSAKRQSALDEPLIFAETPYPMQAPHFVMLVRSQLDDLFTAQQVYDHGGLLVRTSLNLDWQSHAERAIQRHLAELARGEGGLGHEVNNAALVALDPQTGDILAMVGSPDYFDAQHAGAINMALAPRQPGSALKPLVYAAALDPSSPTGGWTAATVLLDVGTSFTTFDGKAYTPANYDLREHGPVLVRQALASSLNIPAVLALDHIGLESLTGLANKLGITTLADPRSYDLSLALGGGAVRLTELTAAYGAFANGGYRLRPRAILEVSDFHGNSLYVAPQEERQRVLDARIAWLISDILSDNDARRLGFGPYSLLRLDRPAAVKTGTTSNFHDNWTIGYTSDLVVGVWSGNSDYRPMRQVNGLSGAAPIWHQFMRTVLADRPKRAFEQPPGMVRVEICALSGQIPGPACPYKRWEWFIEGTQPKAEDAFYRFVTLDVQTGLLASPATPPERRQQRLALDLPPQAHAWARQQGLLLYADLLDDATRSTSLMTSALAEPVDVPAAHITSPASGALFRLSPTFRVDAQRIHIQAAVVPGMQQVEIWLDGAFLARFAAAPYQVWWPLAPGVHQVWVTAVSSSGEMFTSERVEFSVLAP